MQSSINKCGIEIPASMIILIAIHCNAANIIIFINTIKQYIPIINIGDVYIIPVIIIHAKLIANIINITNGLSHSNLIML